MRQTIMPEIKKSQVVLILGVLLITAPWLAQAQEPEQSKQFMLDNGLRVFLLEKKNLPLLNLAFAFNLGSKDESEETSGLVHILEHYTLFRGTELRTADEVIKEIRKHGAYFNAHTDRDLIIFEMSLPSEYAVFALENQREILFQQKFAQEELDKEKKVILEELSQIEDDPIKYGTSLAYQNLFHDHPYRWPSSVILPSVRWKRKSKMFSALWKAEDSVLKKSKKFKSSKEPSKSKKRWMSTRLT